MVRRAWSGLVVLALVASCGGAAPSASPSPTADPSPVASATVTPTASPTPAPVDVSVPFLATITDPAYSASALITGTLSIDGEEGEISGQALFDGADSSSSITISIGGQEQTTESIEIGEDAWGRQSPGPWLVKAPSKTSLGTTLAGLSGAVDLGVTDLDGTLLHHLQPAGGAEIAPEAIGFDLEGARNAVFTIDLYATDDGTPAIIAFGGAWTQVSDGEEVPIEMGFAFDLSEPSGTITPPTDVWQVHTSKPLGYRMAHPSDWAVKSTKAQDAYSVDGQDYVYVVPQNIPNDMKTAAFSAALKADYLEQFGEPILDVPARLGGRAAQRLTYRFTNAEGMEVTIADFVTVYKEQGWEVFIATGGGDEDVVFFETFVATFEFTE